MRHRACHRQPCGDVPIRHLFGDLAEGCASILWRSGDHAMDVTEALRITSAHRDLGVIDAIVPEPLGGAHRDQAVAIASLGDVCFAQLQQMNSMDSAALVEDRARKYLAMGDSEA